jgi:hypothetical protein
MTSNPARRHAPARIFRLGDEPVDDLRATTTAEERLDMVVILSARMSELCGVPQEGLRRDRVTIRPLAFR